MPRKVAAKKAGSPGKKGASPRKRVSKKGGSPRKGGKKVGKRMPAAKRVSFAYYINEMRKAHFASNISLSAKAMAALDGLAHHLIHKIGSTSNSLMLTAHQKTFTPAAAHRAAHLVLGSLYDEIMKQAPAPAFPHVRVRRLLKQSSVANRFSKEGIFAVTRIVDAFVFDVLKTSTEFIRKKCKTGAKGCGARIKSSYVLKALQHMGLSLDHITIAKAGIANPIPKILLLKKHKKALELYHQDHE